jgi:hypothetical protein
MSITRRVSSRNGRFDGDAACCAELWTRASPGCSDATICVVNMRYNPSATITRRGVDMNPVLLIDAAARQAEALLCDGTCQEPASARAQEPASQSSPVVRTEQADLPELTSELGDLRIRRWLTSSPHYASATPVLAKCRNGALRETCERHDRAAIQRSLVSGTINSRFSSMSRSDAL